MMSKIKEPVSGFTHAFGALLSVAGLVLLIISAVNNSLSKTWNIVSFSIFGMGLILLYTFSALYHLLNVKKKTSNILRKFDHIMIFILIASTYTPICLGPLRGPWGWTVFGIVWGLAILGTIMTAIWLEAPRWLTTGIYLGMGWIVIIAVYPLIKTFNELNMFSSLSWLLAGGLSYSVGAMIYGFKWPKINFKHFGFHEIFHIFVLIGSFCHFWFIYKYIAIL